MKKFLFIFLFLIISIPAFGKELQQTDDIEAKLLKQIDFSQLENKKQEFTPITDELINNHTEDTMDEFYASGNILKMTIVKQDLKRNFEDIEDEMISDTYIDKAKNVRKIKHKRHYDFTKKLVPIKIKVAKFYSSKLNGMEGDSIHFVAAENFSINGKNYEEGTSIVGRVETLSASDKMGVPAMLKIDNFYIDEDRDSIEDAGEIPLHGSISKTGANRSIWVYPLYQAGNIMFYVAGFVFVPIHGGHAKISTDEVHTIFYESNEPKTYITN